MKYRATLLPCGAVCCDVRALFFILTQSEDEIQVFVCVTIQIPETYSAVLDEIVELIGAWEM